MPAAMILAKTSCAYCVIPVIEIHFEMQRRAIDWRGSCSHSVTGRRDWPFVIR